MASYGDVFHEAYLFAPLAEYRLSTTVRMCQKEAIDMLDSRIDVHRLAPPFWMEQLPRLTRPIDERGPARSLSRRSTAYHREHEKRAGTVPSPCPVCAVKTRLTLPHALYALRAPQGAPEVRCSHPRPGQNIQGVCPRRCADRRSCVARGAPPQPARQSSVPSLNCAEQFNSLYPPDVCR